MCRFLRINNIIITIFTADVQFTQQKFIGTRAPILELPCLSVYLSVTSFTPRPDVAHVTLLLIDHDDNQPRSLLSAQ